MVDGRLDRVADGEPGELVIGGVQVTPGYWRDPRRTAQAFTPMPWDENAADNRWYRTGDLVRRDPGVGLVFLGRVDFQVKIKGFRVELGEIETHLRRLSGRDEVAAIPKQGSSGSHESVVAFLAGDPVDAEPILAALRAELPDYMVPERIVTLERMPLNANGKIDRGALARRLEK